MLQDVNGKFFGNTGYIEKVLSDNLLVDCMQLTSANSFTPLSINVNQYIFILCTGRVIGSLKGHLLLVTGDMDNNVHPRT
jgi:hypothetical protein